MILNWHFKRLSWKVKKNCLTQMCGKPLTLLERIFQAIHVTTLILTKYQIYTVMSAGPHRKYKKVKAEVNVVSIVLKVTAITANTLGLNPGGAA